MTNSTSEREQRLKQVRATAEAWTRNYDAGIPTGSGLDTRCLIADLLSLLDSEAASPASSPESRCLVCDGPIPVGFHMCAKCGPPPDSHSVREAAALRNVIRIVQGVENDNELDDGGFFEAGFIAAKTKIIDVLIASGETNEQTK